MKSGVFLVSGGYNIGFETGILTPQIYTLSIIIN